MLMKGQRWCMMCNFSVQYEMRTSCLYGKNKTVSGLQRLMMKVISTLSLKNIINSSQSVECAVTQEHQSREDAEIEEKAHRTLNQMTPQHSGVH